MNKDHNWFKHGYATIGQQHPLYMTWLKMKERCNSQSHKRYHRYGGRGIKVCDRWLNSFPNFLADMGEKPTSEHSIDRIDNDGNYEPSNCRWATQEQQRNNTSANHNLTFQGQTLTIAQWARKTGLSQKSIHSRVTVLGWSIEKSLSTPQEKAKKQSIFSGVSWDGYKSKWRASARVLGKQISLGNFIYEWDAIAAVTISKQEHGIESKTFTNNAK